MPTPALHTFYQNSHQVLGNLNALDLCLQVAGSQVHEWKKEEKCKHIDIMLDGLAKNVGAEHVGRPVFGIVKVKMAELDSVFGPVMFTFCRNALISYLTIVEIYLRDLVQFLFQADGRRFKSNREITLTFEDIVDLPNLEPLRTRLLDKLWNELGRDNIATSFENFFLSFLKWKEFNAFAKQNVQLKDLSAIRNIIVHNNSIVNDRFLAIISTPANFNVGQTINIGPEMLRNNVYDTLRFIEDLDRMVEQKLQPKNVAPVAV